jgi:ABC-type nitrate/sulfonate/bicarbonate transport system substrate-binding protein
VGYRLVDFGEVAPDEPTGFIIYGPVLTERNRELGARFLTAYLRGIRRYNEGPTPRNVATIAEYLKVSPEVIRRGWAGIHADGFVDVVRMRRFQDWLYDLGLISVRNPMPTVVDLAFLEQARAALGVTGR